MAEKTIFETLNSINVNEHVDRKNGLTYLSWAWAWGIIKKYYPEANYTIYERTTEFGPVNYFTDGKTCWVKTGLTINGLEHIEELPVMDYKNKSIPLNEVNSFDVNKAIQRSLTKAAARFGLGLYIYAGEDLPEEDTENLVKAAEKPVKAVSVEVETKNTEEASSEQQSLKALIASIGKMAKNIMAKDKKLDAYKKIVSDIAGPDFQCNKATDADYDTILKIYSALVAQGYNA